MRKRIERLIHGMVAKSLRISGARPLLTVIINVEACYLLNINPVYDAPVFVNQRTICGYIYWVDREQKELFRVVER